HALQRPDHRSGLAHDRGHRRHRRGIDFRGDSGAAAGARRSGEDAADGVSLPSASTRGGDQKNTAAPTTACMPQALPVHVPVIVGPRPAAGNPPDAVGDPAVAYVNPISPKMLRCWCASNCVPNDPAVMGMPFVLTDGVKPVAVTVVWEYEYSNRGLTY